MPEKLSIDEFLKTQKESKKVTIEPVKDDESLVKITPWTRDGGCSCSRSIKVKRASIESVSPTSEEHYCCGKTLLVVTVEFKKDQSLSINDVLEQLSTKSEPHQHSHENQPGSGGYPGQMKCGHQNEMQPGHLTYNSHIGPFADCKCKCPNETKSFSCPAGKNCGCGCSPSGYASTWCS